MVVRVASYNTALSRSQSGDLLAAFQSKRDKQILATVRLLQHIQPDIILLNEVDFDPSGEVAALLQEALRESSDGNSLDLPFSFCKPVNTGMPSGRDFDKDGVASDQGNDALGFGQFPGQYGMVLLSRFPINEAKSRTFRHFLWKDMPNACLPTGANGESWYNQEDLDVLPLSSKSHWDVLIEVKGKNLRCLCSHPTPPVFDGFERRNACRNHDEIRFWNDYLSGVDYVYDDQGRRGAYCGEDFVLLGDLNASPVEGDSYQESIRALLNHPKIAKLPFPESAGAIQHSSKLSSEVSRFHTAIWRMQADYVLASQGLLLRDQGVFWPKKADSSALLLKNTSDHRLVYRDFSFSV